MIFRQLFDTESSTYSYLLGDAIAQEAILIDPVVTHTAQYQELVEQLGLRLVIALDTHVHADHITGLGQLRDATRCSTIMGEHSRAECVSETVREGDVVSIGNIALKTLYTPGHTDDSYSFVVNDRVFTGDTLLIRGTGRTDFQNGDPQAQYDSIFGKLLTLPEETLVYPAHDYRGMTVSTIGEEKHYNPRLQVNSAEEYVDIMNGLELANPSLMDIAVPANLSCGKIEDTRGKALYA